MKLRRRGRLLFGVAFVTLLVDGVAAIWLGQVGARWALLALGAGLIAAALGVAALYRKWQAALDEVEAARRALRAEAEALRRALHDARAGSEGDGG
jgi:hypothetical protein